jgi:hypothetical protein
MSVDDSTVSEPGPSSPEDTTSDFTRGGTEAEAPAGADERAPVELPLDQVFEIVKNERRRLAIDFLEQRDGEVKLGELAEHVAALENDTTVEAISSKERKRVYVGLYQCHLPKMDDLDIVEFNQNRGLVRLGPNAPQLDPYIGTDDEVGIDWPKVYLGFSAVGGLLLVASLLGATAVGLTPALIGGLLVVCFGGCAGAQLYRDRTES